MAIYVLSKIQFLSLPWDVIIFHKILFIVKKILRINRKFTTDSDRSLAKKIY